MTKKHRKSLRVWWLSSGEGGTEDQEREWEGDSCTRPSTSSPEGVGGGAVVGARDSGCMSGSPRTVSVHTCYPSLFIG